MFWILWKYLGNMLRLKIIGIFWNIPLFKVVVALNEILSVWVVRMECFEYLWNMLRLETFWTFWNIPLFKVAVAYNEILTVWVVRLEVSDERHQSCSEPQSERVLHFSIFSLNLQNYCCSFFNIFTQSSKLLFFIFQYFHFTSNEIVHLSIFSLNL